MPLEVESLSIPLSIQIEKAMKDFFRNAVSSPYDSAEEFHKFSSQVILMPLKIFRALKKQKQKQENFQIVFMKSNINT